MRLSPRSRSRGWGSGSFAREYRRAENASAERATSASHTIPVTVAAEQGVDRARRLPRAARGRAVRLLRGARRRCRARAAVAAAFAALLVHTLLYAAFLEDPLTWALLGVGTALAARGRGGRSRPARRRERRPPPEHAARSRRRASGASWRCRRSRCAVAAGGCSSRPIPNYDAYYHLVWGRELLDGLKPTFEAYAAPTQHPLYLALAALARRSRARTPTGCSCSLTLLSPRRAGLGGPVASARAVFGRWPGAARRALRRARASRSCSTRRGPTSTCRSSRSSCGRPRSRPSARRPRPAAPMALLAARRAAAPRGLGARRPATGCGAWPRRGPGARGRWLALVARRAAGLGLVDLWVTGDPLHSLHATSDLADELGRERGLAKVPRLVRRRYLADIAAPAGRAGGASPARCSPVRRCGGAR